MENYFFFLYEFSYISNIQEAEWLIYEIHLQCNHKWSLNAGVPSSMVLLMPLKCLIGEAKKTHVGLNPGLKIPLNTINYTLKESIVYHVLVYKNIYIIQYLLNIFVNKDKWRNDEKWLEIIYS